MQKLVTPHFLDFMKVFKKRIDDKLFLPKVQSHRGYCQFDKNNTAQTQIRENTLKSIQRAHELNYNMVEFDVRLTKDKKVILFHDDHFLNNNVPQKISTTFYSDIDDVLRVDLLEEVFGWYQKAKPINFKLNIEIKSKVVSGHLESATYALIKKYKMQNSILISSFNPISLAYFHAFDSEIFRSLLLSFEKEHGNNIFIKNMTLNVLAQPNALHLRQDDWNPKKFKKLLEQKIPIVLWTCNDIKPVIQFMNEGITGIISDMILPTDIAD